MAIWPSGPSPWAICMNCMMLLISSMFCAIASGDTGATLTSKPLTFNGRSIMPSSSITSNILVTNGIMVSLIKRPKAEPKFWANSFMRSTTSVADLALMLSGGRLSSSRVRLIDCTKSLITNWEMLKSPARGRGFKASPCGPPLRATGMIAPGVILMVAGFSTPSSAAV